MKQVYATRVGGCLCLLLTVLLLGVLLSCSQPKTVESYWDSFGNKVSADDENAWYHDITYYDREGYCLYTETYWVRSGELEQRIEYHYDKGKIPVGSTVYAADGAKVRFNDLDERGFIVKETWYDDGNVTGWTVFERDAEGHITDSTVYNADGTVKRMP